MSTISYKEIVRKVHPDLNPHIEDSGAKMAEIQKHKNNPSILFQLAVKWGIVSGGSNHTTNNFWNTTGATESSRRTNSDFRGDSRGNVTRIVREDGVMLFFKRRMVIGKVKDIETVKKGKRAGWLRFTVALTDGRVVFVRKRDDTTGDGSMTKYNLDTVASARSDNTYNRWINSKERQKQWKEQEKESKAQSVKDDLGTNRSYYHREVWVYVRTKKGWFQVTRTTEKSVFYRDNFGNEKRCQFSSVSRVRKD